MTMGKRQLVLAALVVALGAAVYLNWVFTGDNGQLPATQALASGTDRQYGQTLMVNGSAVSGKTSPSSASSGKSSSVKTGASAVSSDDYFSQAMLDRQKARDAATETITKVLEDKSSGDAVKKEAANKAAAITQNIIKENNIETLIKAKGFSNCIVTLDNNQCSVVVKTRTSAQDDAVVIQDIVTGQTGLSFDKIKIIERS